MENNHVIQKAKRRNFEILSTISILLVVMGHTGEGFGSLDWFFLYDSFHMPLFVFISGYFFNIREVDFSKGRGFIKKQVKKLIIPFFLWNGTYGILAVLLYKYCGITWANGNNFFYNMFIRPFTYGNNFFGFNGPSWFILMLFEVKIINYFIRLLFQKFKHQEHEIAITFLYFIGAIVSVWCSRNLERTAVLISVTRALYMLFWLQVGILYKEKLEKIDKTSNIIYFSVIFIIQTILIVICKDGMYAGIWNSEFTNNGLITIFCASTGIAFFLRVSRILEKSLGESPIIHYISTHTFSIMMHQILGFVVLNIVFYQTFRLFKIDTFDLNAFRNDIWYKYLPMGMENLRILYVIFGTCIPLGGDLIWEKYLKNVIVKVVNVINYR